ncbi:MAG: glycosyltransferase family 2 protein [Candidatus Omnitrophica bacterium]|nr:glycosyltransferase family 2 protein [Candidatus Omnitrophota bacterium]
MDISLIIPVYNEEGNLRLLYQELKPPMDSLGKEYEIIFVDDGSNDNSPIILDDLAKKDKRVKVIHFDRNYGKTSALSLGFSYAKGDFILTMDADLQYDCRELVRIIQELKDNDVVICSRINRVKADGFIKVLSSKIANYVRNKVLGENFKDVGCPLKGFRKDCVKDLVLYRGFQVFIPSLMNMRGFKIKEIEVETYSRRWGKSKFNIRNRLWKTLIALLVIKWIQKNRLNYKIKNESL